MTFELDTKALRYFVAVAAHRSYTLAAAHLRITQPAVTRQIQAIEREFGVQLFRRQGRHMLLTESGKVLLDQARDIIERIEAAGSLVKQGAGEPTGQLSIGAPTATGELLLPRIITRYRKLYPRVYLHVVTGYTGDLVEMLASGKLDLALIVGEPAHGDLDMQHLRDMDLGFVAPPASALAEDPIGDRAEITLDEAALLPLIFPSKAQTLRTAVERACRQVGVVPNIVMESDSLGISKALVKAGVGFMFLGSDGTRDEVATGELRHLTLTPPAIEWRLSLATRRSKAHSLATRKMIEEVIDAVQVPQPVAPRRAARS